MHFFVQCSLSSKSKEQFLIHFSALLILEFEMVLARIRTRIISDLPGQRQKEILSQANAKEKNIEKKIEFFFIFFI